MAKSKKQDEHEQKIAELTQDLQRSRADFENYRKRVEQEKEMARANGKVTAIMKLIPVIDNIERAIAHVPKELQDNTWAQGVTKLVSQLEKSLADLKVSRIEASSGTPFNPDLHDAIQFDEDAEGEHEVVAEELQAGYMLADTVMRPSMVKVTRK